MITYSEELITPELAKEYLKKMVNNRYFGHVRVDGLVHWSINEFR